MGAGTIVRHYGGAQVGENLINSGMGITAGSVAVLLPAIYRTNRAIGDYRGLREAAPRTASPQRPATEAVTTSEPSGAEQLDL